MQHGYGKQADRHEKHLQAWALSASSENAVLLADPDPSFYKQGLKYIEIMLHHASFRFLVSCMYHHLAHFHWE